MLDRRSGNPLAGPGEGRGNGLLLAGGQRSCREGKKKGGKGVLANAFYIRRKMEGSVPYRTKGREKEIDEKRGNLTRVVSRGEGYYYRSMETPVFRKERKGTVEEG